MEEQRTRHEEPTTVDTTPSGTHGAGNYLTEDGIGPLPDPSPRTTAIWIEQDDQAKQGAARKFDFKAARAAPDHPHIGHEPGSGEVQ